MTAVSSQVGAIARRSIVRTSRQPAAVVFPLIFPMLLLLVNSGGLEASTALPGFPTDSFVAFALAVPFIQGALFSTMNAGTDLARDIQTGFLNRLSLTSMRGVALIAGLLGGAVVLGLIQAAFYIAVGLIIGVDFAAGALGILVLLLFSAVISVSFGALGVFLALRTGSGEAIQGLFPLLFVFLFLSSMNTPRDLISVDWFRFVASVNPVSYLIECVRSLIITGWDAKALALGFGIAILIGIVATTSQPSRSSSGWCAHEDLAGRFGRRVADAEERLHESVALLPVADLPALLLHRVRGRALAGRQRAGLRLPAGLHGVPVLLRPGPVGGVRRRLHRLRDRAGLRVRLRPPSAARSAQPDGIVLGYAIAALVRWTVTAAVLTVVALLSGMNVFGGPVDVFGMYALALLINVAGLLWACGVAMRFRTIQAGPVMQMPVFLILFFAPVYVPLTLLTGWIEAVATLNPLTYVLEAVRSMLAGDEVHVLSAFVIAVGLVSLFAVWSLRGLREGGGSGLGTVAR